jgi:hypothetical protein
LQPGNAALGHDVASDVARGEHRPDERDAERNRSDAGERQRSGDHRTRSAERQCRGMVPPQWTELRDEFQSVGPELDPHARELRETHAQVIAVRNDHVA